MKYIKTVLILIALISVAACGNDASNNDEVAQQAEKVEKAPVVANATSTLDVEGMTCEMGCKAAIEKHLNNTRGVAKCEVDFDNALAVVEYDNTQITEDEIIAEIGSIANEAYSAKPHVEPATVE